MRIAGDKGKSCGSVELRMKLVLTRGHGSLFLGL